jgi:hypothetical protein
VSCCTQSLCRKYGDLLLIPFGGGCYSSSEFAPACECSPTGCHARDASTHAFDFTIDVNTARSSGFGGTVSLVRQ